MRILVSMTERVNNQLHVVCQAFFLSRVKIPLISVMPWKTERGKITICRDMAYWDGGSDCAVKNVKKT